MYKFICKYCGREFQSKCPNRKYCSKKCVCNAMSKNKIKKYDDLIGKRFGRLVVIERKKKTQGIHI